MDIICYVMNEWTNERTNVYMKECSVVVDSVVRNLWRWKLWRKWWWWKYAYTYRLVHQNVQTELLS